MGLCEKESFKDRNAQRTSCKDEGRDQSDILTSPGPQVLAEKTATDWEKDIESIHDPHREPVLLTP